MNEKEYFMYMKEYIKFKQALNMYGKDKISYDDFVIRFSGNFQYFLSSPLCEKSISNDAILLGAFGDCIDFDKQMSYNNDPISNIRLN